MRGPLRTLFSLALLLALLDQATKWLIVDRFYYGETLNLIPGFFNLTLVHNTGGAFGLFAQSTYLFIIFSIITIIFLFFFFKKYSVENPWIVWPFGLVLGGAIGNLIDRIRLGYVVDFLDAYAGNWHWPAFNVADSAICVGLGFLAIFIGRVK